MVHMHGSIMSTPHLPKSHNSETRVKVCEDGLVQVVASYIESVRYLHLKGWSTIAICLILVLFIPKRLAKVYFEPIHYANELAK